MTKPKPIKPGRGGEPEILEGESILEKLVNQMPQEKREFVLLLMAELGLPKNDPSLPLLIALQYYVNILQDIPEAMQGSADAALKKSLSSYAAIQTRLSGTVQEIDLIRTQWSSDTRRLFIDVQNHFNAASKLALQRYEAELVAANRERLKEFAREWRELQKNYIRDVNRQGMWHSAGVGLVAIILFFLLGLWIGVKFR